MHAATCIALAAAFSGIALSQSVDTRPRFTVADIHMTSNGVTSPARPRFHNGRYEVHGATMMNLIVEAYGVDPLKVTGGPSWLEFNRFDITAPAPPDTQQETLKLMLRSLLEERFGLVVREESQPLTGFALSVGRGKPKLKEAAPSGKTGCQAVAVPGQGAPMRGFSCRNMTMETFAAQLKDPLLGGGYITNTVVDATGLKGSWDFDFKFTTKTQLQAAGSDGITLADAVDKQLGLKLEEKKIPTTVMVVDKVNEKPSANPPDLAQKLPPVPRAEFEVAEIKPTNKNPASLTAAVTGAGIKRSGQVKLPGQLYSLKQLIIDAWNLNSNEDIAGAPKWLDSARYDILAKVPDGFVAPNGPLPVIADLAPMLQSLLIDRFKMKSHFENQQVTAYTLTDSKPKLKKADPSERTGCKSATGPRQGGACALSPVKI